VKPPPPGDIITARELAAYLRVHPSTIYRLLHRGKLPAFRVGSDWRFSREAIERWCLAQLANKQ
jgi:excisionase family DNA binding protein